jgi:hypothetical protein
VRLTIPPFSGGRKCARSGHNEILERVTPDIEKLRKPKMKPVLEGLEIELVDDPAWDEPSDTSYLSPKEKKDPDIASNVEAMAATNKLIAWFGRGSMGCVGLWRGPKQHPLEKAPVVVLDTEGQYSIAATNVADFIAISVEEDEFEDTVKALVAAGFSPRKSQDAIWKTLDALDDDDDPNGYRHTLYNQGRKKRGLKPIPR